MGVHEEQGEDTLVGRDVVRACCQWLPQLSRQREFLPSMVPRTGVPYSLGNREQGRGTRHAQDSSRALGMIAEPTGTGGCRCRSHQRSHSWLSPQGKLDLSLQARVPESASVPLVASPLLNTMASSI